MAAAARTDPRHSSASATVSGGTPGAGGGERREIRGTWDARSSARRPPGTRTRRSSRRLARRRGRRCCSCLESRRGVETRGRAWSLGEIEDGEAFPGLREGGADEDEPAEVGVALFSEGEVVRLVHAGGRRAEAHASGVGVPGDVEGAFALQPAKAEDQRVRVRLDRHLHLGGDRQRVDLAHGSDQRGVVEGGEFAVERVPGDGSRGGGAGDGGTRRHREPRDRARARARGERTRGERRAAARRDRNMVSVGAPRQGASARIARMRARRRTRIRGPTAANENRARPRPPKPSSTHVLCIRANDVGASLLFSTSSRSPRASSSA